jgi:hypothetical protein
VLARRVEVDLLSMESLARPLVLLLPPSPRARSLGARRSRWRGGDDPGLPARSRWLEVSVDGDGVDMGRPAGVFMFLAESQGGPHPAAPSLPPPVQNGLYFL